MSWVLCNSEGKYYGRECAETPDIDLAYRCDSHAIAQRMEAAEWYYNRRRWTVTPIAQARHVASLLSDAELAQLADLKGKCPTMLRILEEILAGQGDHPDREILELQHQLAELLQPRASHSRS